MAPVVEESQKLSADNFQERRALAIAAKAQAIEKVPIHPLKSKSIKWKEVFILYLSQHLFSDLIHCFLWITYLKFFIGIDVASVKENMNNLCQ